MWWIKLMLFIPSSQFHFCTSAHLSSLDMLLILCKSGWKTHVVYKEGQKTFQISWPIHKRKGQERMPQARHEIISLEKFEGSKGRWDKYKHVISVCREGLLHTVCSFSAADKYKKLQTCPKGAYNTKQRIYCLETGEIGLYPTLLTL